MLKKTIKYKDFNDQEREETFFFHLSQAKIIRWNMIYIKQNGLKGHFEKIMAENDGAAAFDLIEKMILDSYGKKTDDGGFLQNPDIRTEFESSPAYSALLMELIGDAEGAAAFLNGIIPAGFADEASRLAASAAAQEERQPNRQERRHPSDTAAQQPPPGPRPAVVTSGMRSESPDVETGKDHAPRPEATSLSDRIAAAERVERTEQRKEFAPAEKEPTAEEPKFLTRQELTEMDDAELRSGLAEGRYKLQ